jgi:cytochrome P450
VNAAVRQVIPPAPICLSSDVSSWRLLRGFAGNSLTIWPDHAYETMIARRNVFGVDNLLINHLDGVRHVLTTNAWGYRRPIVKLRVSTRVGESNVQPSEASDWNSQQSAAMSSFNTHSDESYIYHFRTAAHGLLSRIDESRTVSSVALFQDATLEATLRTLFSSSPGERGDSFSEAIHNYIGERVGSHSTRHWVDKRRPFFIAGGAGRQFQHDCFRAIRHMALDRIQGPVREGHDDLLGFLLANDYKNKSGPLSVEEICELCGSILFSGVETASQLLFWATYLLTLDLSEQERIREEVAAFPPDKVSKLDDLLKWPRLRHALMETLRLYPSEPYLVREAISGDVLLGEEIRPETLIWISPWILHRHRKFWDNPTVFAPDRFSGKSLSWNGGGAFIPFGLDLPGRAGGDFAMTEAQILLAAILSQYEIRLDDNRPILPVGRHVISPDVEPTFVLKKI